jgi:sugar lactone lactonase YvrE
VADSRVAGPVARACDGRYLLGEGPVWDAARERVLWVDIHAGLVLEGHLDDCRVQVTATHRFDGFVGAVAPGREGTLLIATRDAIVEQAADGARTVVAEILRSASDRRLNDGSTDPAGRFLVGSLSLVGESETETLVRLERDGGLTTLDSDLTLSNGLAWSVDGSRMYSVDTLRRVVYVRDYDVSSGAVGARRTHLVVDGGHPDGIAMDATDHLWMAVWGAGEVRRYDPSGVLVERIPTDAPNTSAVAFAGEDLRTLVVTTASVDLPPGHEGSDKSGYVLATRVDVPGVPVPVWSGLD